jgi:hypothetical protein
MNETDAGLNPPDGEKEAAEGEAPPQPPYIGEEF